MTVGTLKRLLTLLNLVAVLALGGTAYGYLRHRDSIRDAWDRPDFAPPPVRISGAGQERIDAIKMRLGKFPETVEVTPTKEPEKIEELETVLGRLGQIVSAIVAWEPYEPGGLKPAIVFKPKNGGDPFTLRLGEAIETRPNPDPAKARAGYQPIPVRYMFVGCEPDPDDPESVLFLFDMKCDGTDIQKARWKGDAEATMASIPDRPVELSGKVYVGSSAPTAAEETVKAEEKKPADPTAVQPVEAPAPVTTPVQPQDGFYDDLFEEDEGVFVPTSQGVDYLRENYQKILKDARTETYRDPATGRASGIQVTNIRGDSVANKFGIQRDDVILAINNRPVTKQAQAVNIVKEELRANKNVIEVKILRYGQTIVKRYDTRDPATRRAARDAFRNRR